MKEISNGVDIFSLGQYIIPSYFPIEVYWVDV